MEESDLIMDFDYEADLNRLKEQQKQQAIAELEKQKNLPIIKRKIQRMFKTKYQHVIFMNTW